MAVFLKADRPQAIPMVLFEDTHTIRWTDGTETNVDGRERPELFLTPAPTAKERDGRPIW